MGSELRICCFSFIAMRSIENFWGVCVCVYVEEKEGNVKFGKEVSMEENQFGRVNVGYLGAIKSNNVGTNALTLNHFPLNPLLHH